MKLIDQLLNPHDPMVQFAARLATDCGDGPQDFASLMADKCEGHQHELTDPDEIAEINRLIPELRAGLHNERIAALMGYV